MFGYAQRYKMKLCWQYAVRFDFSHMVNAKEASVVVCDLVMKPYSLVLGLRQASSCITTVNGSIAKNKF